MSEREGEGRDGERQIYGEGVRKAREAEGKVGGASRARGRGEPPPPPTEYSGKQ